jgi:hypothetical protein
MDNTPPKEPGSRPDPDRFEWPILLAAFGFYAIERCLVFAFLTGRAAPAGSLESQILEFFFGKQPYSIFDILLGFDFGGGWIEIFQPRNIILVMLQILHFWINYWVIKLPLLFLSRWFARAKE